jgi:hypothetical protein
VTADDFARLESKVDRLLAMCGPKRPSEDGQIYKDPKEKYWTGESYAGCKFSECPPDYLRAFAKYKGACVWAAKMAHEKSGDADELKYVGKNEGEAKLALAWAEFREASGSEATPAPAPKGKPARNEPEDDFGPPPDGEEIPF